MTFFLFQTLRLQSTFILACLGLLPFCSIGQVTLPNPAILKKNKVKNVVVFQQNLPSVYADTTQKEELTPLDQAPFIWAKYWLNAAGYPDSMYNYMQGVSYRKEVYTYGSPGKLKQVEVFNHRNESVNKEVMVTGKKGSIVCKGYSKGQLKTTRLTDKNHRVIRSKIYTDAHIYGYDSLVFYHDFAADTSIEKYYLNGVISHQLSKKWLGDGPDSFYQSFYQSNAESGRMPSYSVILPVSEKGTLVVPRDMAFAEMFASITYSNRFEKYIAFEGKLSDLLVETDLVQQSQIIEQKRSNVTLRHFYTFDYGVK